MGKQPQVGADAGVEITTTGGTAPGKRTRTAGLPATRATAAPAPPGPAGASMGDQLAARDDPFGLHLIDPADLDGFAPGARPAREPGARSATLFPSERYLAHEVERDFALLKPAGIDVATAADYAKRVEATFGSVEAYLAWRGESNALLARPLPDGGTLARLINEHGATQEVFFYWVSWAYHKRGMDADATVKLITAGITPELKATVDAAADAIGAKIPIQGFCPRPQRDGAHYLLGTFSEHGLGRAVDIEPNLNPILVPKIWNAIEAAVGRRVERTSDRWKWEPDALYDDLDALCNQWVMVVEAAIETQRQVEVRGQDRAARSAGTLVDLGPLDHALGTRPPPATAPGPSLLREPTVVADSATLRATAIERVLGFPRDTAAFLAALPGLRFLNHPRQRVLALRQQGLLWGALFDNVDLHHFEVPKDPLPPWTPTPARRPPTRTDLDVIPTDDDR